MFAHRLKELRNENNMAQVQLAELLGVSKGTVAMWEIGKREPSIATLRTLSDIFDRRIDYILGYSNDTPSPALAEEDKELLNRQKDKGNFYETIMVYLRLDKHGKRAVEGVIRAEATRCHEHETLLPEENFSVTLRIKNAK